MGGGLMQLVAYGAQDIYLTGNPQITFFKVVYRRHTNFSMEAIQQTFDGTTGFGNRVSATISRNGDLVYRMYIEFNPQGFFADSTTTNSGFNAAYMGHTLIDEVELEIGGQKIDKHYGHWLTVWNDLTEKNESGVSIKTIAQTGGESTGEKTLYQLMSFNHKGANNEGSGATAFDSAPSKAWVPLQFWFCRNPGLALPLIALQYHEVKIMVKFCSAASMIETVDAAVTQTTGSPILWADYIYLDTDERRRFAQVSHEYLIEQLQFSSVTSTSEKELNFNHPVKELIWVGTPASSPASTLGVTGPAVPTILAGDYQLKLNGHDRFAARNFQYFTRTQIWQHHTGFGGVVVRDSIGVYSFALKPEEHQPSGTCNFSRIDNAQLIHDGTASLYIYAVNYNVLRIMSGMGGLAYSN